MSELSLSPQTPAIDAITQTPALEIRASQWFLDEYDHPWRAVKDGIACTRRGNTVSLHAKQAYLNKNGELVANRDTFVLDYDSDTLLRVVEPDAMHDRLICS